MSDLKCENNLITMTLKNTGTTTITAEVIPVFKFLVNGEEKIFSCQPKVFAIGEETKCIYPVSSGRNDVEFWGSTVDNIEKGTVVC